MTEGLVCNTNTKHVGHPPKYRFEGLVGVARKCHEIVSYNYNFDEFEFCNKSKVLFTLFTTRLKFIKFINA